MFVITITPIASPDLKLSLIAHIRSGVGAREILLVSPRVAID